jgi:hypothetical protein
VAALCQHPRGTLYNRAKRRAMQAGCARWGCHPCGRRKARKVADRFARLHPDFLMTLSLPRSAWPTAENNSELQRRCRWLLRYMTRHGFIEAYGWVYEVGEPRPECVCLQAPIETPYGTIPALAGCVCGANGRQLHRHFVIRAAAGGRNRYGRPYLPYARLQAAAKRCGLGTLDFQPVRDGAGAARYVAKYLGKSLGGPGTGFNLGRAHRYAMNVHIPQITEPGWQWDARRVALVAVERLGAVAMDWDATYYDASQAHSPSP